MTQAMTTAPLTLAGRGPRTPGTTTRRTLTSEFLLVRPMGTVFWLAFRDVVGVDGKIVTEDPDRLPQLFTAPEGSGLARAQRIAAEGARHLLAPRPRTMTSPVLALAFLQSHHQGRFRYRLDTDGRDEAAAYVTLRMEEVQLPTLIRTDAGQDLPLRGRFERDPRSGAVLESARYGNLRRFSVQTGEAVR